MANDISNDIFTFCDQEAMDEFLAAKKTAVKQIQNFNSNFNDFQDRNCKLSREILKTVTAYNILNSGPPCVYPLIEKEEILEEMLLRIQEKTNLIGDSILSIINKLEELQKHLKILQKHSQGLNWNPKTNPSIKGNIHHYPPNDSLEDIADIIFQYEVSITAINQYFDVLNLKQPKSYENLMNSFKISQEVITHANEFIIRNRPE